MKSSAMLSVSVIDASVAVWATVPLVPPDHNRVAVALLQRLNTIWVPELWVYEVTSATRKLFFAARSLALPVDAEKILTQALRLPDKFVQADLDLVHAAYRWAERLGQAKAYDAFYLALAERLGVDFWTGDQRLYRRARQVGADFVRFVGEA